MADDIATLHAELKDLRREHDELRKFVFDNLEHYDKLMPERVTKMEQVRREIAELQNEVSILKVAR